MQTPPRARKRRNLAEELVLQEDYLEIEQERFSDRMGFAVDAAEEVRHALVPSLILQHREDSLAPLTVGEYLHQHLKNSRLQVLDVAGHCAHMSHPELVVSAMRNELR